jgi:hypothetical protein
MLLTSSVPCDCAGKVPTIEICVSTVGDHFMFVDMNQPAMKWDVIQGEVEVSRHLAAGEYETVISGRGNKRRFLMQCGLDIGESYQFWIYKNPSGDPKIQPKKIS